MVRRREAVWVERLTPTRKPMPGFEENLLANSAPDVLTEQPELVTQVEFVIKPDLEQ